MKAYRLKLLKHTVLTILRRVLRVLRIAFVAILFGLLAITFHYSPIGYDLDVWVARQLYSLRGAREPPARLVLVTVNDETFTELGQSPREPLSRKYLATLINELTEAKPRWVVLDFILGTETHDPEADLALRDAIANTPTVIAKGFFDERPGVSATDISSQKRILLSADSMFLESAALAVPFLFQQQRGVVKQLSYTGTLEGVPLLNLLEKNEREEIAQTLTGSELINFYGPANTFRSLPYARLVSHGLTDEERVMLTDSFVLIGLRSDLLNRDGVIKEQFVTPVSLHPLYGVEVHANILSNLLERNWITPLQKRVVAQLLFSILFISTTLLLLVELRKAIAILVVLLLSISTLAYWMFAKVNILFPGVAVLWIMISAAMITAIAYRYVRRERVHRQLESELGFDLSE